MALTPHTLYAVSYKNALISQVVSTRLGPGVQELIAGGDGQVDPTYAAVMSQSPTFGWTTTAIKAGLDAIGIDGGKIAAAPNDLDLYLQSYDAQGLRGAGSTHIKVTNALGIIVPRSITASQGQVARYDMDAYLLSADGIAAPFTVTGSSALEGTPSVAEQFTLGPVKVNGTALEGVESTTITFGIRLYGPRAYEGHVFPYYVAIASRTLSIDVRVTQADLLLAAKFGISGVAQGATDSVVYLRKLAEDGTRVAEATEEHISWTMDQGRAHVVEQSADHPNPYMATVRLSPTYDGEAAILVLDTTAAIA